MRFGKYAVYIHRFPFVPMELMVLMYANACCVLSLICRLLLEQSVHILSDRGLVVKHVAAASRH